MKKIEDGDSIRYKLESGLEAISSPGDDLYDYLLKLKEEGKPLIVPDKEFFKGVSIKGKAPWNWKIGITNVTMKLNVISTPSMPNSFGSEYKFPDLSENIGSQELGNWLMKLASWKSYALKLLAKVEIERIIADESYDTVIAKGLAVADRAGRKVTKDVVAGNSLMEVEGFRDLRTKLIEKKAESESLKKIIDIYSTQLDAISREISRRSMDMKGIGQGL